MNTNNTTIVWNEQSDRIMAFRQAPNNIIFTNEDLSNNHCRDIVAKQSIATNGGIVIPDEMELNFRSGDHIVINPGFSVKEGVDFLAVIENIPDCGTSSKSIVSTIEDRISSKSINSNDEIIDFSYSVYPNPANNFITIDYNSHIEEMLSIDIVNILGRKIKTILPKQTTKIGNQNIQTFISEFAPGVYFIVLTLGDQIKTEKIIIH